MEITPLFNLWIIPALSASALLLLGSAVFFPNKQSLLKWPLRLLSFAIFSVAAFGFFSYQICIEQVIEEANSVLPQLASKISISGQALCSYEALDYLPNLILPTVILVILYLRPRATLPVSTPPPKNQNNTLYYTVGALSLLLLTTSLWIWMIYIHVIWVALHRF